MRFPWAIHMSFLGGDAGEHVRNPMRLLPFFLMEGVPLKTCQIPTKTEEANAFMLCVVVGKTSFNKADSRLQRWLTLPAMFIFGIHRFSVSFVVQEVQFPRAAGFL